MIPKMPYEFLRRRVALSWAEVHFCLQLRRLTPSNAIDHAVDWVVANDNASKREIELASCTGADWSRVPELVSILAAEEGSPEGEYDSAKWLYLALAWLFENRDSVSDPLIQVEMIYADFDYPPEITSLVYYMPCDEPDLGSRELNEARIYANWENYLQAEAKRFSPQPT